MASGNVGTEMIRRIQNHPDLQLVGLHCYSADKVGRDAGDIACIAAHEFGHALGLDGHSDRSADLMYPVHRMGSRLLITARDLRTLATVYPELVSRVTSRL